VTKKINMEYLARRAGVSKSTVSRALKDSNEVSEKTKEKIRRLAYENDYRLTKSPWEWMEKKSPTITVVLPTGATRTDLYSAPFALEMLGKMADELADHGYSMLLTKSFLGREDTARTIMAKGPSEGIIFLGQRKNHQDIKAMARMVPNIVVWGGSLPDANYCIVGTDNREGGKMATKHLHRLGRKRIAFFGDRSSIEPKQRFLGFKDAHEQAGIPLDKELIIETPYDFISALTEIRSILRDPIRFDAVFAANDVIAMNAILGLKEAGYSVPGDVSVIGFDDISMANYSNPPLTTIRQNIAAGSTILVESVVKLIAGENVHSTMMSPELIVRKSCGAHSEEDRTPVVTKPAILPISESD